MKLLYVTGHDFSAVSFETAFARKEVSDIIENIKDYTLKEHGGNYEPDEEADEYWEIQVIDVGEVSDTFIIFVRNRIQDYDDSKQSNFWFENETI